MAIITGGIKIDESLNKALGLPKEYPIDRKESFKIFQYLMKLFKSNNGIGVISIMHYIDEHGDIINNQKTKMDKIIKIIVNNMDKNDQFAIMSYIDYYNKGFCVDKNK